MLSGHISNQDEEDVEAELVALEESMKGTTTLPEVPSSRLPGTEGELEGEMGHEPARLQQSERQAMLA